jgi:non-heme chloroperoxidase
VTGMSSTSSAKSVPWSKSKTRRKYWLTEIYYKDWGTGQPIVFHHGWPLSADDWDTQMLFFLERGYRVIIRQHRTMSASIEEFHAELTL